MSGRRLRLRHLDDHHDSREYSSKDLESQGEKKEHPTHPGGVYHDDWYYRILIRIALNFRTLSTGKKIITIGFSLLVIGLVILAIIKVRGRNNSDDDGWLSSKNTIPMVPTNTKVSVVIMNHNRPRMLKESTLIQTLSNHPNIDEILLCHSNPQTKFDHDNPIVRNIDAIEANQKYGLSLRFHYAATEVRNPWVIHVDDDQEMTMDAISHLLGIFSMNPHRIVGRYGRLYNLFWNQQRHGYNTRTILGPVEVVLTKFMVMETRICHYFDKYRYLINDKMLTESHPLWNGEDIFMSLVANHVYGVPLDGPYRNFALKLNVWEASDTLKDDDTGNYDISGNMDRHRIWNVGWTAYWKAYTKAQSHTAYRGRLWDMTKQQLSQLPIPGEAM